MTRKRKGESLLNVMDYAWPGRDGEMCLACRKGRREKRTGVWVNERPLDGIGRGTDQKGKSA